MRKTTKSKLDFNTSLGSMREKSLQSFRKSVQDGTRATMNGTQFAFAVQQSRDSNISSLPNIRTESTLRESNKSSPRLSEMLDDKRNNQRYASHGSVKRHDQLVSLNMRDLNQQPNRMLVSVKRNWTMKKHLIVQKNHRSEKFNKKNSTDNITQKLIQANMIRCDFAVPLYTARDYTPQKIMSSPKPKEQAKPVVKVPILQPIFSPLVKEQLQNMRIEEIPSED